MIKFVVGTVAAVLMAGAAQAATIVTVEAAGVQNTSVVLTSAGVETFDAAPLGFVSPLASTFGGSAFSGSFDAVAIGAANQYGGAGGTGQFVTTNSTTVLTLTGPASNYFGLWASALDGGNSVEFYKAGSLVDSISLVGYPLDGSYNGNPTANYFGQNSGERYAFFNFVVGGGYDEVHLVQNSGGGFELDNVTVGTTVPEPATWGLMIVGFGMVGFSARRRKVVAA